MPFDFFSSIDGGEKNSVSPGPDEITIFIDGEKHNFPTKINLM